MDGLTQDPVSRRSRWGSGSTRRAGHPGQERRRARLMAHLEAEGSTLLGVGPMSKAGVDAAIELGREHRVPVMLIASRRQIECDAQGSGYVNGWSTEAFARYVRDRDPGGWVLLCRDHGGPWQSYREVEERMDLAEAMASAQRSLEVDLEAGFDVLHLDPSIPPPKGQEPLGKGAVLEMLFELYHGVQAANRDVLIEVGTEEQNGGLNEAEELDEFLRRLRQFTDAYGYPMPTFCVAQTGTLVKETRNVGLVGTAHEEDMARRTRALVSVARTHGIYVKEHNGDYLSDAILGQRPQMGIGATNIAPEYGVAETRFLLELTGSLGLVQVEDEFLEQAYQTGKWKKWMVPGSEASDRDRAIIAGHYVFGTPAFQETRARIQAACAARGIDLERATIDRVKAAILRTAQALAMIR